jgi:hypothetical protein
MEALGHPISVLAPTSPERMIDAKGRPCFLWDEDITLEARSAPTTSAS